MLIGTLLIIIRPNYSPLTFQRKYRSSEYELGSPVLEDNDSFVDENDKTWTYGVESGILANRPDSEVQVVRAKKTSGFKCWKENYVKNQTRDGEK